ncbi:hypothetical protein EPUS_03788 [Endocarpon pusillum Z07020]|uniref:Uncharacterized protein n=1 Tax=Endocarpon pusillum (strain Z07020 / HMAS-L-300199) TaxID=1263415 RepID=U1HEI2_ENDPU|nr:uncharacterized protein EPUS_03788 [Endocarpon pusillum Z07020]ERF68470.1 hypothetical protein EPUS_03788 [Endocarpon pusillum Z07020]
MEFVDRREYVERRPDGELQWVRAPRRREHRTSGAWVRESRRRRSYAVADNPATEMAQEMVLQANRLQRNLPSFPEVECLLRLYVATGEGRGAYLAAKTKMEEEKKWRSESRYGDRAEATRRRQRFNSRHHGPLPSSSGSSDDDRYDGDDGLGGRPPHRPPSGGPSGSHPEVYRARPDGRHPPAVRRDNRAWIPLQVIENDEWRFVRAEEYDPNRREEYRPYYPEPTYFIDRPRLVRRPRSRSPPHVVVVHEHNYESGPYPAELHIRQDHRRWQDQEAHRPPRPTVEDAPEDEDDREFAPLPSEEDDVRVQRPSRQRSREVRNRIVQIDRTHNVRLNRTRIARSPHTRQIIIRGGHGADHNFDEDSDGDVHQLVRMRGGSIRQPLTKTSSILAGVIQKGDYETSSKYIVLYFFHTSKGKVISSRKPEPYITFQELGENQPAVNADQLSDMWLVAKLQQHYWMINRRQRSAFEDLIRMKTIGFATFIRFERTVKRGADTGNFVVTAKVPAVSAGGEAVSHFLYSMKYPLRDAKMMLFLLDRLAGTTQDDEHCFYVVEIKETFDTSKIYVLLILLILVSAGAGTAYAVVQSDPSTGVAIASFVLTSLTLILALVAAGQWLGLSKPDSFSFAYDWDDNRILGSTDADKIFGPGPGVM